MPVQIDSPFTPDSSFRPYLIVVTGLGMLIPPTFFFALMGFGILNGEDGGILAVIAGIFVVFAVAGGLWAYLYCRTVSYLLTPPTEMTWGRGVLWKQTGIVPPYNRITNVDIIQGPVMRLFGISNLRIQTAGYSANQLAEIKLQGIRDPPEPLRAVIMDFVRSGHSIAAVTGAETITGSSSVSSGSRTQGTDAVVLQELRDITMVLKRIEEKMQ